MIWNIKERRILNLNNLFQKYVISDLNLLILMEKGTGKYHLAEAYFLGTNLPKLIKNLAIII